MLAQLQQRADQHQHSVEDELLALLTQSLNLENETQDFIESTDLATRIHQRLKMQG